jgi:protein-L-isoaspartate(D-aspartate) O-methyltransferase
MVREQVFDRGITDRRVLRALLRVPRHRFLDASAGPEAYTDHALPIGFSQTMSQPYMVAYLAAELRLEGEESVLEIGTGSGYQAAVLAALARRVYTIERIPQLASKAADVLAELGIDTVYTKTGDGAAGWREMAPFDRILLTAAAGGAPPQLLEQLCDGGFLLGPVVGNNGRQEIVRLLRRGDRFAVERLVPCSFVPLIRFGDRAVEGLNAIKPEAR